MRKSLWITPVLLLIAGIATPTVVRANEITYTVNDAVGAGNVTGFITTDATIGTLATGNILDWNLIVNDGTDPTFNLLGPTSGNNSGVAVSGADLTSTATQLLFNFSGTDNGYLLFANPFAPNSGGPYVCFHAINLFGCTFQDPGSDVSLSSAPDDPNTLRYVDVQFTPLTGVDVIATAGVVATPEPSSAALTLLGIGSLMVVLLKRIGRGLQPAT